MTEKELNELDRMYSESIKGSGYLRPSLILTPEGAICINDYGIVTIKDFDDKGNFYNLAEEEQIFRKSFIARKYFNKPPLEK